MSRTRYTIKDPTAPHFLTATIVGWYPLFIHPEHAAIVLNSMRFLHDAGRWTLYGYVVMENHIHWIAQSHDLRTEARAFKSYTARALVDALKAKYHRQALGVLADRRDACRMDQSFQVWQRGSHPKPIYWDSMFRQKLQYIHQNPVKRGYVDDPTHWRYSSARDYAGRSGLVPVTLAEVV